MVLSPLEQHGPAAGGGADPDPGAPAEQRVSTEVTLGLQNYLVSCVQSADPLCRVSARG